MTGKSLTSHMCTNITQNNIEYVEANHENDTYFGADL